MIGRLSVVVMKLSTGYEINVVSLSLELNRIINKRDIDSYDTKYIKILEEIFIESARRTASFSYDINKRPNF